MSESTSTIISVAPHSTDSLHASSTQHSRMADPGSTKKLRFYKSGDPRFNGIKMVVSNRSFKTFDALLDNLSKKVPLPFGVRNITTPRGMHHITSLEQLEDGKSYICSHQRKIKPINLERASKKPLLWQSSRPISARRRAAQLTRHNEVVPFKRENTIVIGSSQNFVICKNGDKDCKYTMVLNRKPKQSFDAILDQVSEALQFPVFKLYSSDGRRILSMHALLLSSGTIVATGREPFKHGNYNSEREFLPSKLPGISQRVFPRSRPKPDRKSRGKSNEPLFTSPSGQEYSQSSANVSNKDDSLLEYSHIPDNEMCLTERWPHSGEEIPLISPGDNIEKTVHLNSDGTMTVEMKVRFKIRQEETINWSTTVSRSDITYYKKKHFCSEAVTIKNSQERSPFVDDNIHEKQKLFMGDGYEPGVEKFHNQLQDNDINTNKCPVSSPNKEKSNFHRPPTPGIRKGQEKRTSVRRTSEDNLREHMKQMFNYQAIEHETTQSTDDIEEECSAQISTTSDNVDSNGANHNTIDRRHTKHISKLHEDSFELLESTLREMSQTDTVYEKDVRKSLRSDFVCVSGSSKQDRPNSAGKRIYQKEQFRFKEIKRSMSTSVTYSEPSKFNGKTKHVIKDIGYANKEDIDIARPGNDEIAISAIPNSMDQTLSTLEDKTDRGSENDTCASNDNNCTPSMRQKKKKKKKTVAEQANISDCNSAAVESENLESQDLACEVPCQEVKPSTINRMFEDIFPSSGSPHQPELRKLKSDKKMAKVKPSSVKACDKLVNPVTENSEETKQECTQTETGLCADCSGIRMPNCSVLYIEDSPTQDKSIPAGKLPKKIPKTSKASKKIAKKQKNPKKITKSNKTADSEITSVSNSLESDSVDSATLPAALESYVQNWLKNIFPNAAFPMLQLISSTKLDNNIISVNSSGDADAVANSDKNLLDPNHKGNTKEKEIPAEHSESSEDNVYNFMEKNRDLAELVAQSFHQNNSYDNGKPEEIIKWLASQQILSLTQKKPSTDAAIQVENDPIKKVSTFYINGDYTEDILKEQFDMSSQNINRSQKRHLEKSFSLPSTPLKPPSVSSSSPQLLLAWLIVLHLKQGMYNMGEDVSYPTNNFAAIFTLLQSLKKIAITEKADDLKAAILHLQESTVEFDTAVKTVTRDFTPTSEYPPDDLEKSTKCVQVEYTNADHTNDNQFVAESSEKPDILRNGGDCDDLTDDTLDDFKFFSTIPYRELSGEFLRNDAEHCTLLGMHNNLNNEPNSSLENIDQSLITIRQNSKEHPVDLSRTCSPILEVDTGMVNMENNPTSPKMVSKVKMMVQEMEQRKYSTCGSEAPPKHLQSPLSSDWSDYRQDSEDSDTMRASSEIMTESGEEQIHEKPVKSGFVKRAIERLYGKGQTKVILPKTYVSPKTQSEQHGHAEYMSSNERQQCMSKGSMSRSSSSPTNKIDTGSSSLKSLSVPQIEDNNDHNCLLSQNPSIGGVLIDKGRWLLKENHLVRKSPPEASGMYGNLDTTSADTLLDNTSDDVPYLHPACKANQPIAEVSSSELEDMAKPQPYTCHYFSMPHGSDSEPFNDTTSFKSKIRPKSSGGFVKSKTNYSLESVEKCGGISGSLPSFATVDFNFPDNKVHPLPQSAPDNSQKPDSSAENGRQIQEQDSLDKLQFVCGQHCPILTAVVNHVNEKDRGFVYCSPYDIENQLLHPLLTGTALSNLFLSHAYTDENNNILSKTLMDPIKISTYRDTDVSSLFNINNFESINLLRNRGKGRQSFPDLYPISLFTGLDYNENDENNNNLYLRT